MPNNKTSPGMRQTFIITKIDVIKSLVERLNNLGVASYSEMQGDVSSIIKGGSFQAALADAKILGLVEGSDQLTISEQGKRFLEDSSPTIVKTLALKIPLFGEMHHRNLVTRLDIEKFLELRFNGHYTGKAKRNRVRQACFRYMELILENHSHSRTRKSRREQNLGSQSTILAAARDQGPSVEQLRVLAPALRELHLLRGKYSRDEIIKLLEVVDELYAT